MQYDVISSGSSGNATIVISDGHAILLDFGISKRRIQEALKNYGLTFSDLQACLLTHTHSDHASQAFQMPLDKLYSTSSKVSKIDSPIKDDHILKPFDKLILEPFTITILPLSHDAHNTCGFVVSDGKEELVYLVDTGFVPEKDFPYLKGKDYYVFESNHDPEMLYQSSRPEYLIRRIISDTGHLSNVDSAYYLSMFVSEKTKEIVLAHLSKECNNPSLALSTFEKVMQVQLGYLPNIDVRCASDEIQTQGGRK